MDNHEFFLETYKPFDDYLKKHKYDPKTNTIEIDGKRELIKTKMSNKEMNRLNKFLRENKYDPKTETILTDVDSGTSDKKKRVKFTMNSFSQRTKGAHYKPDTEEINMPIKAITTKPSSSNQTLKHEEGHFNDFTKSKEVIDAEYVIKNLEFELKHSKLSEAERKKIKDQLAIAKRRYQKLQMQKEHIDDIKNKANEFNKKQDLDGNVREKIGKYTSDHDIIDSENYADYYGSIHNKYGDKSKNVAASLFNSIGYHKKNINKYKAMFKDSVFSIYNAFKDEFSHPLNAMEKAGVFETLGIEPSSINSLVTEQSNLSKKLKELRREMNQLRFELEKKFPRYNEYKDIRYKIEDAEETNSFEEVHRLENDPNWINLQSELNSFLKSHSSFKNKIEEINDVKNKSKELGSDFCKKYNITNEKLNAAKKKASDYLRLNYVGTMSRQKFVNSINEMYLSNIITESEYVQLQERIQILTERSE